MVSKTTRNEVAEFLTRPPYDNSGEAEKYQQSLVERTESGGKYERKAGNTAQN